MATVSTRATRREQRRSLRAVVRARSAATRVARKATKAVATGAPQPAKTHLIAAGLDPQLAKRFSGAFSQRVEATAVDTTVVKLKGRVSKRVTVKLYSGPAFAARLAVYRPKNPSAAAAFAALAA